MIKLRLITTVSIEHCRCLENTVMPRVDLPEIKLSKNAGPSNISQKNLIVGLLGDKTSELYQLNIFKRKKKAL